MPIGKQTSFASAFAISVIIVVVLMVGVNAEFISTVEDRLLPRKWENRDTSPGTVFARLIPRFVPSHGDSTSPNVVGDAPLKQFDINTWKTQAPEVSPMRMYKTEYDRNSSAPQHPHPRTRSRKQQPPSHALSARRKLKLPAAALPQGSFDGASTSATVPLDDSKESRGLIDRSRLCYCNYGPPICDATEQMACLKHKQAACFHAIRQEYHAESRAMEAVHLYGCAPLEAEHIKMADKSLIRNTYEASLMTCASGNSVHATPTALVCCYEGNFCNKGLLDASPSQQPYTIAETVAYGQQHPTTTADARNVTIFRSPQEGMLAALFFLGVGCFLGVALVGAALVCYGQLLSTDRVPDWLRRLHLASIEQSKKNSPTSVGPLLSAANENAAEHGFYGDKRCDPLAAESIGSGSGSAGITLNQRTIALDLTMLEVVARGRYGEVRKAIYRGTVVAVKTFITTEEESWRNERDIYQTQMLNHENILQYVAADISSNVDFQTQMMLITDYHPLGSLYDYLRRNSSPISIMEAMELALSTISGIEHLHNPVQGTGGRRKPEIAHRDIKSKNVIVKRCGVCCIADFGLAIRCENRAIISDKLNIQVGTKRYMAPELLARTLNPSNFDEFKRADVYSYALVLWEILNRTRISFCDTDEENSASALHHPLMADRQRHTLARASAGGFTQHYMTSRSSSSGVATGGGGTFTTLATASSSAGPVGGVCLASPLPSSFQNQPTPVVVPFTTNEIAVVAAQQYGSSTSVSDTDANSGHMGLLEECSKTTTTCELEGAAIRDSWAYALPYERLVDNDPSIEQMRKVVWDQRMRPPVPSHWATQSSSHQHSFWLAKQFGDLMTECWSENAMSRHTAYKIKKELLNLVNQVYHVRNSLSPQGMEAAKAIKFPQSNVK